MNRALLGIAENLSKVTGKEIKIESAWNITDVPDTDRIPKGDMPGDKIEIYEHHVKKARIILPALIEQLLPLLNEQPHQRAVIAINGGSGVGKSVIASLISYYLNSMNLGSYILSGDNYPHRIPKYNDAERIRVYREAGIKGLVLGGEYTAERNIILQKLQEDDSDTNPEKVLEYPWLLAYQEAGKNGLKNYLGTINEIDFAEVSNIISRFKSGATNIILKRMGREEKELWYDSVDFSNINVLVIEWTHGNNDNLEGVDIPILLNSTPQETLEHRRFRNRDGNTDSPFTTMVLNIEQGLLSSQAAKAKIIVTKCGEIVSYDEYIKIMA